MRYYTLKYGVGLENGLIVFFFLTRQQIEQGEGVQAFSAQCGIYASFSCIRSERQRIDATILDKHGIPFYTDIQMGLASLDQLMTRLDAALVSEAGGDALGRVGEPKVAAQSFKHIVAGHGEIYTSPEQAKRVIQYTAQRLESILELVRGALADGVARPGFAVLQAVAGALGVDISTLSQYVLCNTTVQAALSALSIRGEVWPLIRENSLTWQRKNDV